NQRRDTYVDRQTIEGRANGGIASILQGNSNSYLAEFTLGYKKTIDIHDFNFLLGITGQQFNDRAGNSQGSGFSSDATKTDNMGLGDPTKFIVSSSRSRNSLLSYLGRANYNLLDKYLFTASLRIDGSSRCGENNQYGVFPSFAFGWKLDQEDFIKSLDIFNSLKLRASWGRTGNQEIGNYQSMSTYAAGQKAVIGEVQVSTTTPSRLPNPNLKWETSEQLNFVLDFSDLKLDQEDFIKSLDIFNSLKLRASWGRTGNQEIGNYQSMSTYAAGQKAVIGEVQVSTTTPSRLPNPNLKWETSEQLNFGLDF